MGYSAFKGPAKPIGTDGSEGENENVIVDANQIHAKMGPTVLAELSCALDGIHLGYVVADGKVIKHGGGKLIHDTSVETPVTFSYVVNSACLQFVLLGSLTETERDQYFPEK